MNESITADKCVSPRQFISQAKHAMSSHVVLVQLYQLRGVFEELWAVNQVLFICRTRSDPTSQMAYVTSRDILSCLVCLTAKENFPSRRGRRLVVNKHLLRE